MKTWLRNHQSHVRKERCWIEWKRRT